MEQDVLEIIGALIAGGGFVKFLEYLTLRGKVKQDEKSITISIQGDLLDQLKQSLDIAKQDRDELTSCQERYERLQQEYEQLHADHKQLRKEFDALRGANIDGG